MFIANTLESKREHGRIGILLSSKVARGSVNRNFWRRRFYDLSLESIETLSLDIVLVPKKGTILDHKNETHLAEFKKNIQFLYKSIKNKK